MYEIIYNIIHSLDFLKNLFTKISEVTFEALLRYPAHCNHNPHTCSAQPTPENVQQETQLSSQRHLLCLPK